MTLLFSVLGSCLVAASTVAAADAPADHSGEPWWSKPPTAESSGPTPKVIDYAPTARGQGAKASDAAPAVHAGQAAEFAPNPPGSRQPDTRLAAFQQDAAPAASAPATGTPADNTKTLEPSLLGSAKPLPPRQLPANQSVVSPIPPEPAVGRTLSLASPHSTAQSEPSPSLGLSLHSDKTAGGKKSPLSAMITVGGSLAMVLGLFFIVAWTMRKTAPRGSLMLPKEVFDILGRAPLGARQQVQLLRCGNKLLLVSITPHGTETLTEVTDPLEVDRIAGICQQAHPKSTTVAFRQVFQQLAPKTGEPAGIDGLEPTGTRRKRYRWEEKHA